MRTQSAHCELVQPLSSWEQLSVQEEAHSSYIRDGDELDELDELVSLSIGNKSTADVALTMSAMVTITIASPSFISSPVVSFSQEYQNQLINGEL